MATLKQKRDVINVTEMKDGDVAEIITWNFEYDIGKICQRHKDVLILIGFPAIQCYDLIFSCEKSPIPNCMVRILPKGTEIVL